MRCGNCARFTLHLNRRSDIGLCSEWVQVQLSTESCNRFGEKELPKPNPHHLTINGKTVVEWRALKYGMCYRTGKKLSYAEIKRIAIKHNVPFYHIEQFKKQKQESTQLHLQL